ncbi:Transcription factor GTE9 [Morus notabilis]|uniref:Transcription factor GTE9 n=1 Tax=Morus notabilis TaxID=981085 RepID=W9QN53_9ROSA|nr:Transcription factor GTE9 [Morus notabilis]
MENAEKSCCSSTLKVLTKHHYAWGVFMQPVDPVALQIPDYFDYIKKKTEEEFVFIHGFVDDVRLTFSNATAYNPPFSRPS